MWHIDEIIDSTCKQNKAKKNSKVMWKSQAEKIE